MPPTPGRGAPKEPIDTTGDPALEARWQALVDKVAAAKADAIKARGALVEAEQAVAVFRSGGHDVPGKVAEAEAKARHAYRAAGKRLDEASKRMKAGDL
jgi:hypothetical protein